MCHEKQSLTNSIALQEITPFLHHTVLGTKLGDRLALRQIENLKVLKTFIRTGLAGCISTSS